MSSRSARAAATRERLLEAAGEVFVECGYEGCAMVDIARRAGVTTGAIYSHFRDKSEMLLEVMRRRLKQQTDIVKAYVKSTPDINEAYLALARDRLEPGMRETRALLTEILAISRRDPTVREVVSELLGATVRFMTSQIKAAQEAGLIDGDIRAPALAFMYLTTAAGEAWTEAAGLELVPQDDWLALVQRLTRAVAAPNPTTAVRGSH
jgi:TetR/AcrR family transcriptional repressor of uid operon